MSRAKFQFSNVVVVDEGLIGVIVKTWEKPRLDTYSYEVYVRYYNQIREYLEEDIKHYVFSKELSEDERNWH